MATGTGLSTTTNLPLQFTSFIGRESEIAEVQQLLGETRLLTLVGAGGSGKSRLAQEVGARVLDRYGEGVWWVDLAPVENSEFVASAVASALLIREVPTQPLAETLSVELQHRTLLLLLDNCEHLLPSVAELTKMLLRRCPSLTVLATSRAPLDVSGEIRWRVPSLGFPDAEGPETLGAVSGYDAVRLFVERARQVRPAFELSEENAAVVASIARRLDGIPLALELAAVRTDMLSAAQIEAGLADRFRLLTTGPRDALPRHRTLQGSVNWSYELLSPKARTLLPRLSVFVGDFSLEGAQAVCSGEDIKREEFLSVLTELVDKSLVQVEKLEVSSTRYRLLETIRQYAGRKLVKPEAARDRHLDFYLDLAERAEPELERGQAREWLSLLEQELDNLRAAMEWAQTTANQAAFLRLVTALRLFWLLKGRLVEGRARLEVAAGATGPEPRLRARALWALGQIAVYSGDVSAARSAGEDALAIAREQNDNFVAARALMVLGWSTFFLDPQSASPLFEEGLDLARAGGDLACAAYCLEGLGLLQVMVGRATAATPMLEEALAVSRQATDTLGILHALAYLGMAQFHRGNFSKARAYLDESLLLSQDLRDPYFTASVPYLALVAACTGRVADAAAQIHESLPAVQRSGYFFIAALLQECLGFVESALGNTSAAATAAEQALLFFRSIGQGFHGAWSLTIMGDASLAEGNISSARSHHEEALRLARETHNAFGEARALHGLAKVARCLDDGRRAASLFHEALAKLVPADDKAGVVDILESLAGLAADHEKWREAARLLGTASSLRHRLGYETFPIQRSDQEGLIMRLREHLGATFDEAWDEGRALSMEDAVVGYATKGRGTRKRPVAGWASLTPVELQVVRLVGEGLTNPQIGERLFISKRTVGAHLSRIFVKLGVSTRAELAAEATRRQL